MFVLERRLLVMTTITIDMVATFVSCGMMV
jgi:hypothetical protein